MPERRNETKSLIKAAEQQGFRVQRKRDGVVIYGKDNMSMVSLHFTCQDHRAFKNNKAALRRMGVEC